MKYIIIGAGGTGGILGFYMTKAGIDLRKYFEGVELSLLENRQITKRALYCL